MANNIESLKPKKAKEEVVSEAEEATEVEVATNESEAKKKFRYLIARYKKQNPAKYEMKKEAFEKKLAKL